MYNAVALENIFFKKINAFVYYYYLPFKMGMGLLLKNLELSIYKDPLVYFKFSKTWHSY